MFRHIYLSNPHWWFSASDEDDAYITQNFIHLLDDPHQEGECLLNMILIYDQLPRHIFRNTPSKHIISWYLRRALDLCFYLTPAYLDTLTTHEWCFAMLPYRHTNDPEYIIELAKLAWANLLTLTSNTDISVMRRFLKATYERCPTKDQSRFIKSYQPLQRKNMEYILSSHKNILDYHEYDIANICVPSIDVQLPQGRIILSLSGGVDSMVCSYILAKQNVEFEAVHINYGNRTTADAEEEFVKDWCGYLGIPLHVRRITEIKREPCMKHNMRDIYETYTRQVRLGTYSTVSGKDACIIILGHNKDDCFENIMTNIAGRTHYENLSGMSHEKFYRPLLHVSKADIKAFAAYHGIPHLPNSTPTWSQRGQIRASIVPVLDAWDPLFVPGMHHLSAALSQYHQLAQHLARLFVSQPSMDLAVNNACFWRAVIGIVTPEHHPSVKSLDNLIKNVQNKTPPYTVVITKHLTMKINKAGTVAFLVEEK